MDERICLKVAVLRRPLEIDIGRVYSCTGISLEKASGNRFWTRVFVHREKTGVQCVDAAP